MVLLYILYIPSLCATVNTITHFDAIVHSQIWNIVSNTPIKFASMVIIETPCDIYKRIFDPRVSTFAVVVNKTFGMPNRLSLILPLTSKTYISLFQYSSCGTYFIRTIRYINTLKEVFVSMMVKVSANHSLIIRQSIFG